jgi:hypothetical protein
MASTIRVPKLVGSKWVYEYPVSGAVQSQPTSVDSVTIPFNTSSSKVGNYQENTPREIPIQRGPTMTENSRVHGDWRGPWPTDNLGPKPRLVGGKLITPKLIASHSAGQPTH